jgi:DNA primase
MQQPSDEIKSKLDIVDVIREYIPLKPAGVNFRALCPFHREKSPSFVVSPEKQIWHCFGCSKGGDIFSFVMEMDGVSFVDALRNLAPKAGVTLRRQDPKLTSQRNRLLDIVEYARSYYCKTLLESPKAESARKYLNERGLTEDTIEEWQVGYSPDSWDDLINLLIKKGYKDNEIFLAGMSVKKEGTSRFYNRFRGRIMFPINDINGNTVAFSARVSPEKEEEEKMGKYINSPQTMIYDKGGIIFGLDKARQEIKKQDSVIVVEGQMDVITAHQNGYKNVVASSGTALTSEQDRDKTQVELQKKQMDMLKRYSKNIFLAFDMDKAGEMAAERGIKEAMRAEMNTKVILIPEGKDPDECIKNNREEWETAVKDAKPIMEYYFNKALPHLDLKNIESINKINNYLLLKIIEIKNQVEQDFWLKKLSQKTESNEMSLRDELAKIKSKITRPKERQGVAEKTEKKVIKKSREEMLSELFIALILKFPSLIEYSVNHIQQDQIVGAANAGLYRNLIIYYNNLIDNWTQGGGQTEPLQISYKGFKSWLENLPETNESHGENIEGQGNTNNQLRLLDKLVLLGDKDFFELEIEQAKNEVIKIIIELKKNYFVSRRKEINKLIAQTESGGDEEGVKRLMEEFKALTDEIGELGK